MMFGICFVSLGARHVTHPEQYTIWFMSQIYQLNEKEKFVSEIDELKIKILKIMLDTQKKGKTIEREVLSHGILGQSLYFDQCFEMIVDSGLIEKVRGNKYYIPQSKILEVENIIK